MRNSQGDRWTEADVPVQRGRTAVITGANTGLGFETARVLAAHGAQVVLACRDLGRAKEAVARIRSGSPQPTGVMSANLHAVRLDLSSLASVREAAEEIGAAYGPVDLLINNAGVMMTPYRRTADGFELQLGVNHLGHFALTGLLLDRLLTVTTRDPGTASIASSSRPVSAKWPRWLVPNCNSNPSAVVPRGGIITPALLMSRSRRG